MNEHQLLARQIRKSILEAGHYSQEGHVPTSLSVVECFIAAEAFLGSIDDFVSGFILSKGHAALGLYAFLESRGLLTRSELENFATVDSKFGGHPTRSQNVLFSSGSLGHGLPFAVGLSHANRTLGLRRAKTVCLVGDGELNEGSNWEAIILASRLMLSNLYVIVDDNRSSQNGSEMIRLSSKFRAFGFGVAESDGHSVDDMRLALTKLQSTDDSKPKALVARTVKGKGIKQMEENPEKWHHSPINDEDFSKFFQELDA